MSGIIVFSATKGFRHESISAGVRMIEELAAEQSVDVFSTEDAKVFTSSTLAGVDAVVWLQTSGTGLLNQEQRAAYAEFTENGGGFAGIHAASDCERDWPLFGQLVGARFQSHPTQLQVAPIRLELPADPCVTDLPNPWNWEEEWYAFDATPRPHVNVIASIDEGDYSPEDAAMGVDHPLVWRGRLGAAQTWYTALGHKAEACEMEPFRSHIWGGIASVLRTKNGEEEA